MEENPAGHPSLKRIYTWADLGAAGLSRRQTVRHRAHRITRGVYATDGEPPLSIQTQAILGISGPQAIACGVTALRLAGVELPRRLCRDTRVWVQVPRRQSWPQRRGVRLVRSERTDPRVLLSGVPTLALSYCWIQLAGESSVDELVELADALTRRHRPAVTRHQLEQAVKNSPGTRGVVKARRALEDKGWRIITVTSADLFQAPTGVVNSTRQALHRHG